MITNSEITVVITVLDLGVLQAPSFHDEIFEVAHVLPSYAYCFVLQ